MSDTPTALRRRHRTALKLLDRYQARVLRLVRATCEALEDNESRAWTTSSFPGAYGILANKCLSHAESIRELTGIGRYGDAHAILRALISDAFMCRFLWEYQDKIPAWFSYADKRHVLSKQERLKIEHKFGDAAVRRGLKGRGMKMTGIAKLFGFYSEANHASSWGARFYARRESKSRHTLQPSGHFNDFTANTLSNQTIFFIDHVLLNTLFVWLVRERSDEPWAIRLIRRYERLGGELDNFYEIHADYLDASFSMMDD